MSARGEWLEAADLKGSSHSPPILVKRLVEAGDSEGERRGEVPGVSGWKPWI